MIDNTGYRQNIHGYLFSLHSEGWACIVVPRLKDNGMAPGREMGALPVSM